MVRHWQPSIVALTQPLLASHRRGTYRTRDAYVKSGVPTTFVIPGGDPDADSRHDDWLGPDSSFNFPAKSWCAVHHLTSGHETFLAMRDALETVTGSGHHIFLIGWSFDHRFPLPQRQAERRAGARPVTMGDIFRQKVAAGAALYILRWQPAIGGEDLLDPDTYSHLYPSLTTQFCNEIGGSRDIGNGARSLASAFGVADGHVRHALRGTAGTILPMLGGAPGLALSPYIPRVGCHHQKILIVNGSEGLIGFFGGVDIFPDRTGTHVNGRTTSERFPAQAGSPMHDVHMRVMGGAARDLLKVFCTRWEHCPEAWQQEQLREPFVRSASTTVPPGYDQQKVRIVQTVGNPAIESGNGPNRSDYYTAVHRALWRARRFIYIQDQYMWSDELATQLNGKLRQTPDLAHLTIVIPHIDVAAEQGGYQREMHRLFMRTVLENLSAEQKKRVSLCVLKKRPTADMSGNGSARDWRYVHSKLWIIDDEIAIVGSANLNNRGYHHDSESGGVVVDHGRPLYLSVAHRLRIDLWEHHLSWPIHRRCDLHDGAAAGYLFRYPGRDTRIARYRDTYGDWADYSQWSRPHWDHAYLDAAGGPILFDPMP